MDPALVSLKNAWQSFIESKSIELFLASFFLDRGLRRVDWSSWENFVKCKKTLAFFLIISGLQFMIVFFFLPYTKKVISINEYFPKKMQKKTEHISF